MQLKDRTSDASVLSMFSGDLIRHKELLKNRVYNKRFLIVGGAGTIGSAVALEVAKRKPAAIHIVDISENNLAEAVRLIRSTLKFDSELLTFSIDVGSREFDGLINYMPDYDYILNLSALKHVRSEKDPFTLSRLVQTNIFNAVKLAKIASDQNALKYFCVSTDKAANPANLMGASKRLMELFLLRDRNNVDVSFARFANVLFSDGSLTYGFTKRFEKRQPITAPYDIKRFFITPTEAGELCLLSTLLGTDLEIYFPKLYENQDEKTFQDLAIEFLKDRGFEAFACATEEEAIIKCEDLIKSNKWPCHFFRSDTSGEKSIEEFYTSKEIIDLTQYLSVGVVKMDTTGDVLGLHKFEEDFRNWQSNASWDRNKLKEIFERALPELRHIETGKNLDQRM